MNKQKCPFNLYVASLRQDLQAKGVTKKRIDGLVRAARAVRHVVTQEEVEAIVRRLITLRGIGVEA